MAREYQVQFQVAPGPCDLRCLVFSSFRSSSIHRFVRVKTADDQRFAYAELRGSSTSGGDDVTVVSGALAQHLCLDGEDASSSSLTLELAEELTTGAAAPLDTAPQAALSGCHCEMGIAHEVQVRVMTGSTRSPEYFRAIKKCARPLLHGTIVWRGRRLVVEWSGQRDTLVFSTIDVSKQGTGCCQALVQLTKETHYDFLTTSPPSPSILEPQHKEQLVLDMVRQRVGGYQSLLRQIVQGISTRFEWNSTEDLSQISCVAGGLLTGVSGVGKSFVARAVAESLAGVFVKFLHGPDIFEVFVGQSEEKLIGIFKELEQKEPSLLVIDEIECICVNQRAPNESVDPLQLSLLSTFLACLNDIQIHQKRVFVLGTTSHLESVDLSVLCNERLEMVLPMDLPDASERLGILQRITSNWDPASKNPSVLKRAADSTAGYVGADMVRLCQEAVRLSCPTEHVDWCHFEQALIYCSPSVLQNHQMPSGAREQEVMSSHTGLSTTGSVSTPFDCIFGLDEAISTLRVSLLDPLADCSRFLQFGSTPPKGILLVGPSGSGKSLLAQAVADEVRQRGLASFVSVRCTDLLSKVVGDTEKALRELFQTARNAAPCVLFFDQIETLAPCRGFDTTTEQTFDRLLSMLLVEMDGFKSGANRLDGSSTKDSTEARKSAFLQQYVVILASTTEKKLLDPAILRPGRFDVHISLQFPDEEARKQIILKLLDRVPVKYDPFHAWGSSKESVAAWLAQHTDGLAANRLESLFREAAMASLREDLEAATISIAQLATAMAP